MVMLNMLMFMKSYRGVLHLGKHEIYDTVYMVIFMLNEIYHIRAADILASDLFVR